MHIKLFSLKFQIQPTIELSGRSILGACEDPTIRYKIVTAVGPWPVTIKWTVEYDFGEKEVFEFESELTEGQQSFKSEKVKNSLNSFILCL